MKKLFIVLTALAFIATLSLNLFAVVMDEHGNIVSDNAYSKLYPYVFDDKGGIIRDDYAGCWVEPGKEDYFYIAVTPDADMDFYRNILAASSDYEFVTHKYSLKTLSHMRDVVMERCPELFGAGGVYEKENVIGFGVIVSEEQKGGRIAAEMLRIKNEENLPDGIENAFVIRYGIWIDLADYDAGSVDVQTPVEGKICTEE